MSAENVQDIIERAMTDARFRDLLAKDPQAALASYDLTEDERALFSTGTAKAERLEDRVSKNDLSAAFAIKTGGVVLQPPSQAMKKDRTR